MQELSLRCSEMELLTLDRRYSPLTTGPHTSSSGRDPLMKFLTVWCLCSMVPANLSLMTRCRSSLSRLSKSVLDLVSEH